MRWDSESGESNCVSGKGHTNQVSRMMVNENHEMVSCSMDDTVRFTNADKNEYSAGDVVKMDSQPKNVSVGSGGLALTICIGQVVLLKDKRKVFTLDKLDYEAEVGALHPGGTTAAVGDSEGKIHLYSVQGTSLVPEKQLDISKCVIDLEFSPNGAYLAAISESRALTVFTVADNYTEKREFYGHHAKPVSMSWSPDCEHIATGGMDTNVFVWVVSDPDKRIKIQEPHRMHHVSGLAWIDDHTLVTTSYDACVKQWTITY